MKRSMALMLIENECIKACKKFNKFNTYHEGKAVIEEELDELWDEIKGSQNKDRLREEAVQVGAMAVRFLMDCIKEN